MNLFWLLVSLVLAGTAAGLWKNLTLRRLRLSGRRVPAHARRPVAEPGRPSRTAPYRYDFSGDYIVSSCEKSLRRLGVETIDVYQLHRPDYLMDPVHR